MTGDELRVHAAERARRGRSGLSGAVKKRLLV